MDPGAQNVESSQIANVVWGPRGNNKRGGEKAIEQLEKIGEPNTFDTIEAQSPPYVCGTLVIQVLQHFQLLKPKGCRMGIVESKNDLWLGIKPYHHGAFCSHHIRSPDLR
jgi:hypothetical protein